MQAIKDGCLLQHSHAHVTMHATEKPSKGTALPCIHRSWALAFNLVKPVTSDGFATFHTSGRQGPDSVHAQAGALTGWPPKFLAALGPVAPDPALPSAMM